MRPQSEQTRPEWKRFTVKHYAAVHKWISRTYGKASHCENCIKTAKRFEWANISGEYKRERDDWKQLCPSCHRKADYTDEQRQKMSISKKGAANLQVKRTPVNQIKNGLVIANYTSVLEAARLTGIRKQGIHHVLANMRKSAGGFQWEKVL